MEYRIIRKSSVDEDTLFHSDRFLGDEFSDDLYHWKYIKREKKNGKWRYYYDKEQLKNDVKKVTGYQAKEDMLKYEEAIKTNSEKLAKARAYQKENAAKIPEDKARKERYETEANAMATKTSEYGFDYGLYDTARKQANQEYEERSKQLLEKKSSNKLTKEEIKQEEAELKKLRNEINKYSILTLNALINGQTAEAKRDLAKREAEYAKATVKNRTKRNYELQEEIVSRQRASTNLKKNYITSKNIYDKSLAGFIDRGKARVDGLLDSIRKKKK